MHSPGRLVTGLHRLQVRGHHGGDRVVARLQGFHVLAVVEKLGDSECQLNAAAPALLGELRRLPIGMIVAKEREAYHFSIIQPADDEVILEHSPRERFFLFRLDLEVDEDPAIAAVAQPDFEQFVREAFAELGPAQNLLKFLVERLIAA